jgi:hypothetical protein
MLSVVPASLSIDAQALNSFSVVEDVVDEFGQAGLPSMSPAALQQQLSM